MLNFIATILQLFTRYSRLCESHFLGSQFSWSAWWL